MAITWYSCFQLRTTKTVLALSHDQAVESVTAYTTRRSERLSLKSRSSSEAIDKEIQPKTPVKRARKTRDNGAASKDTCKCYAVIDPAWWSLFLLETF